MPLPTPDLTGRRFGRLVPTTKGKPYVIPSTGRKSTTWQCQCDCGEITTVHANALLRGATTSCGCYRKQWASENAKEHGLSKTVEYHVWRGMIQRCTDPNTDCYDRYGGRGITVCARWRKSFEAFLGDMGKRPSSAHSVERIDNAGGYEPSNCRWATDTEQSNNRRSNHILTHRGVTGSMKTIWKRFAVAELAYGTFAARVRDGWDLTRALSTALVSQGYTRDGQAICAYSNRSS